MGCSALSAIVTIEQQGPHLVWVVAALRCPVGSLARKLRARTGFGLVTPTRAVMGNSGFTRMTCCAMVHRLTLASVVPLRLSDVSMFLASSVSPSYLLLKDQKHWQPGGQKGPI